ncbi:MAG: alpha/beta hydrolase [Gammaproteobacteria bacterium]
MFKVLRVIAVLILAMTVVVEPAIPDDGSAGRIVSGTVRTGFGDLSFILIKPLNSGSTKKRPLFIFMHGQGSSPQNVLQADYALLTRQNFYVVLPQAPTRQGDGFSWYKLADPDQLAADLARDEGLIRQMIDELLEANNVDPSKIVLSGFSQGGRVAFYVGLRNPKLFSEIAPIAGGYNPELLDSRLGELGRLKINIFHGTMDEINPFEQMKNAYVKMKQAGANVTLTTYLLGHTYTTEILSRVLGSVD